MAEGNPGGISAMIEIAKVAGEDAFMDLLTLDDMNMRGPQIWVGFKDWAKSDVAKFREGIKARSPEMIAEVNRICLPQGIEAAVDGGASFKHI